MCISLLGGFIFCSVGLLVFITVLYCFDYQSSVYVLMSGGVVPSTLFFFLKIVLTIQRPLRFHTNFVIAFFFLITVKKVIGILH